MINLVLLALSLYSSQVTFGRPCLCYSCMLGLIHSQKASFPFPPDDGTDLHSSSFHVFICLLEDTVRQGQGMQHLKCLVSKIKHLIFTQCRNSLCTDRVDRRVFTWICMHVARQHLKICHWCVTILVKMNIYLHTHFYQYIMFCKFCMRLDH